jgi:hypothetical protein
MKSKDNLTKSQSNHQGDQMGRFVAKMRSVATLKKVKIDPFLGDKKGDFGLKKV